MDALWDGKAACSALRKLQQRILRFIEEHSIPGAIKGIIGVHQYLSQAEGPIKCFSFDVRNASRERDPGQCLGAVERRRANCSDRARDDDIREASTLGESLSFDRSDAATDRDGTNVDT